MFDTRAFMATDFSPRTEDVEVTYLYVLMLESDRLPEQEKESIKEKILSGEKFYFTVKGLTSSEIFKAQELAATKAKSLDILTASLSNDEIIANEIRSKLGYSEDSPYEYKHRLEHLVLGCVEPKLTLQEAVKISEVHPNTFLVLTNTIRNLSGLGYDAKKKPLNTGNEPTLETP